MDVKIGDLAEKNNLTTRALRFYEESGLLLPRRSRGKTRYYDASDEARLAAILELTQGGLSIGDIAGLAKIRSAHKTGDSASREVADFLEKLRKDIIEKIKHLDEIQGHIEETLNSVESCRGCRKKPQRNVCLECGAIGAPDKWSLLNLIVEQENEGNL